MRRFVTLGGGGFSMEPDNPLLDDFLLGLTGVARPRVCFVPTAGGDSDNYVMRFYQALARKTEARTSRCSGARSATSAGFSAGTTWSSWAAGTRPTCSRYGASMGSSTRWPRLPTPA
jgi:hypothetical protein